MEEARDLRRNRIIKQNYKRSSLEPQILKMYRTTKVLTIGTLRSTRATLRNNIISRYLQMITINDIKIGCPTTSSRCTRQNSKVSWYSVSCQWCHVENRRHRALPLHSGAVASWKKNSAQRSDQQIYYLPGAQETQLLEELERRKEGVKWAWTTTIVLVDGRRAGVHEDGNALQLAAIVGETS